MIRVNLIADRYAKEKIVIQQQAIMSLFVFGFTIFLCVMWWQNKASAIETTNNRIEDAKKELNKQKKIRQKVKDMEAKEKLISSILKTIEFLTQEKQAPVAYLDNLNVILPSEIWLTNLTDSGGRITINGFSFSNNSVAQLMRDMEKSRHFAKVELSEVTTTKIKEEALKKFKLTCMTRVAYKKAEEKKKRELAEKKKRKKRKK
ncbi:hypothetical protein MNBD_NITROSPINAE02-856 [hydrothermal vent metagenome]|uniref:Type IV pilus biogenesis protein PilN n=1 Tax=hydrothermal vent metagenome TaxID=652676 RepID=A0A3B1D0D0_9ZZZZ